ncbi:Ribose import ATP-binding protein rbsA 2 [Nostocoides japonicum T1-X7]|uniref:Ribose import ATP-binding protein rbsA 2 n=1 Tax=Nostocoides japonicum T1-X7 TaxID=1194083 RepID=A0A077LYP9_9MICO|nr:sugar ABC transporter ATP-binding protein [Tetrasphaera japonica]CCH78032.1 Ribose import ATP-binding protein rbsA 2 [Tetrasphaera japonica T1-X7]
MMLTVPTGKGGTTYEAHSIDKAFSVPVLRRVDVVFHPGEIHTLVGENGAGKSTLLKIMSGVYAPDGGRRILDGEELGHLTPAEARRRGIYLVPQEPRLMPDLSVAENLYLGALPRGRFGLTVDWRRARDTTSGLLETVGLSVDPRMLAGRLPLAHQQLLECARALAQGCRVIFFDEPTSPLTAHEADTLFALMRDLRDRGLTLGFISHRFDEVEDLSDRITVLRDGSVVGRHERGTVSRPALIEEMVGRALTLTRRTQRDTSPGEVVLSVEELVSPPEVNGMSIDVRAGEIVGLAGLVGSGRTELAETVFGLRQPTAGRVTVMGRDVTTAGPDRCIADGLVYLAEDRGRNGIFADVDLGTNATSAVIGRLPGRVGLLDTQEEARMAQRMLVRMNVKAATMTQPIASLSGGNQQKVLFARWVLAHPRVAIFDEPTRGVDVGAKEGIYQIIEDLAGEGLATLVISSELEELVRLCDRVYAVYEGRIVGQLRGDAITVDSVGELAVGAA